MYVGPLIPDPKCTNTAKQAKDANEVSALLRDIRRVILSNRSIIDIAPLQIYMSALVFSPAYSMTRKTFRKEEPKCIITNPALKGGWNACRQTLEGHISWIRSVAFLPDSTLIASASDDKTVKIWEVATGRFKHTTITGTGLQRISFHSTGSRLYTDVGIIDLSMLSALYTVPRTGPTLQPLYSHNYGIGQDRMWITRNSENWLWMLLDYRLISSATAPTRIVIGCASGEVVIMTSQQTSS